MQMVEVSRTLVKSLPELWEERQGEGLKEAVGASQLKRTQDEYLLVWEGENGKGIVTLEPSGWGTKVVFRVKVEEEVAELEPKVARLGFWARLHGMAPPPRPRPRPTRKRKLEQALEQLMDDLGAAHRKPFQQG